MRQLPGNLDDCESREIINEAGYRWKLSGDAEIGYVLNTYLRGEVIHSKELNPSWYLAKNEILVELSFDVAWQHYLQQRKGT